MFMYDMFVYSITFGNKAHSAKIMLFVHIHIYLSLTLLFYDPISTNT